MSNRAVHITGITPGYENLDVSIDGQQMTRALRGFSLDAGVGNAPRLTLDMAAFIESTVEGKMTVIIPDETHAALVALGWTPPADGQE
jgi:hypothetical protein